MWWQVLLSVVGGLELLYLALLLLRSVLRHTGPGAPTTHWPVTPGARLVERLAGGVTAAGEGS